jgi:hypothetical protein
MMSYNKWTRSFLEYAVNAKLCTEGNLELAESYAEFVACIFLGIRHTAVCRICIFNYEEYTKY